jgi:hypothetical protein
MRIHVAASGLRPVGVSSSAARGFDDGEVSHSCAGEAAGKSDLGAPMSITTRVVVSLLSLESGENSARVAERSAGVRDVVPEEFHTRIRRIGRGREVGFRSVRRAKRIRLTGQNENLVVCGMEQWDSPIQHEEDGNNEKEAAHGGSSANDDLTRSRIQKEPGGWIDQPDESIGAGFVPKARILHG